MNNGWVKLHRNFRENPFYTNSTAVHCWIECLLRARHNDAEVYIKRRKVVLKAGQFVMGRDEFGKSLGISASTAWYWILQFFTDNMIDITRTSKGSVVSIKNWNEYQNVDSTSDNRKTTDEQQKNTNKNDKNEKNEKNIYNQINLIEKKDIEEIASLYEISQFDVSKTFETMKLYCESNGKKYKNYKAALQNWIRRDLESKKISRVEKMVVIDLPSEDFDMTARILQMKKEHGLA